MKRSYREALGEAVLAVIRASGSAGVPAGEIRERLPARGRGISTRDVERTIQHLRATRAIRSEGPAESARCFVAESAPRADLPRPGQVTSKVRQEAVDRAVLGIIRQAGDAGARSVDVLPALRGQVRRSEVLCALRRLRRAKKIRTEGVKKGARNFVININANADTNKEGETK